MSPFLVPSRKGEKMYTSISTLDMPHKEWLALRKTGLGGSDAGAICGLNPYTSPIHVYRDKVSEDTEDSDNESMRQGRDLEDYVAKRFMEATGLKVRRSNMMYRNTEHPCLIADVDRLIVGEDAGLECKTASAYNADKWKDDKIPAHYLAQCYHYMAVTGKKAWYIAVVILGKEFKYAKIERDEEIIQNLISIEEKFWKDHVEAKVMPDPDGSEICDEVLNEYFNIAKREQAIELHGFDEKLRRREEVLALKDKLEQEQKQIEQEIKLFMQNSEIAFSDNYRVSWSNVDTTRIDTKRLKEEQPELYKEFLKVTTSRRFSVRAA